MNDPTSAAAIRRRAALGALATASAGLAAPRVLRAQGQYPTRPVQMVVGFPPGGQTDYAARILAPGMSAPVRVTTDAEFYDQHPDSTELWSPGSPLFPSPEGTASSEELQELKWRGLS